MARHVENAAILTGTGLRCVPQACSSAFISRRVWRRGHGLAQLIYTVYTMASPCYGAFGGSHASSAELLATDDP
ncbi:MAG: hypothetical protein ACLR7U_06970 [Ruthenibacterium lactatiformans]